MQLARNISDISFEKTILRKAKEIVLSFKLEQTTKDEILELYLNAVFFGKRAYGIEAAARTYYGKPLAELSVAQWAMLAGVVQRPSQNNPINDPAAALRRRDLILYNMNRQGTIDDVTYEAALAEPVTAAIHDRPPEVDAPWVAEWARQQALDLYGRAAYVDGLEVFTTIDPQTQAAAQHAIVEGLNAYDRRHGYRGPERLLNPPPEGAPLDAVTRTRWVETLAAMRTVGDQVPALVTVVDEDGFSAVLGDGTDVRVPLSLLRWARPYRSVNQRGPRPERSSDVVERGHLVRLRMTEDGWALGQVPEVQGSIVALHPQDGAVRALVGGYDFGALQFNHALQAQRQPGSGFKPFMYAAAIDAGRHRRPFTRTRRSCSRTRTGRPVSTQRSRRSWATRMHSGYRSINLFHARTGPRRRTSSITSPLRLHTRDFPRNLQLAIGGAPWRRTHRHGAFTPCSRTRLRRAAPVSASNCGEGLRRSPSPISAGRSELAVLLRRSRRGRRRHELLRPRRTHRLHHEFHAGDVGATRRPAP